MRAYNVYYGNKNLTIFNYINSFWSEDLYNYQSIVEYMFMLNNTLIS